MPWARDPKRDEAFEIYKKHNGNIDLIEIANQLSLPPGTVRGWKSKDKWAQKLGGAFQKSEHGKKARERSERRNAKKEVTAKDVKHVMDNPDLTDKQRLFCLYYVRCFNATKAYQKAYECDHATAAVRGSVLLKNVRVRDEVYHLKQNRLNRELLDEYDIVQKYMDIAFSDITDYVTFNGRKVLLKDSETVDGSLISEVSQGKEGIKIKLLDQQRALDWLAKYFEINPESRHRREYDKRRLEIELLRLERDAPEMAKDTDEDNFIETLKESAKAVWDDVASDRPEDS